VAPWAPVGNSAAYQEDTRDGAVLFHADVPDAPCRLPGRAEANPVQPAGIAANSGSEPPPLPPLTTVPLAGSVAAI